MITGRLARLDMCDADVRYLPDYLEAACAESLLESLMVDVPWEQPMIRIFGRTMPSPRLHRWYGDPDAVYAWSGRTWQPTEWIPALVALREQLETQLGTAFNSCLANLYRNGRDSMGLHADDEPELGTDPVIASISLGATRCLQFRHKSASAERHEIDLEPGSLLVMAGLTQQHWKHQLPKRMRVEQPRINLTFRNIIAN